MWWSGQSLALSLGIYGFILGNKNGRSSLCEESLSGRKFTVLATTSSGIPCETNHALGRPQGITVHGLREIKGSTGIGLKSGFNRHQNSWKWRALSPHVRETRTWSQHRTGYFAVLSTCSQFSESLYWQRPWPFNP